MDINDKNAVSDAIHEADSASLETCSIELVDDTHWRCFCGQVNHVMDEFCTACSEPRPNEFAPHASNKENETSNAVNDVKSMNDEESIPSVMESRKRGGDSSVSSIGLTEEKHTLSSPDTDSNILGRNRQTNDNNGTESKVNMYRKIAIAGVCLAVLAGAFAMFMLGREAGRGDVSNPNVAVGRSEKNDNIKNSKDEPDVVHSTTSNQKKVNTNEHLVFISYKNSYHDEIANLANDINAYLQSHPDFKNEGTMLGRAENIRNQLKQTMSNLDSASIPNKAMKKQLYEVFDAELGRVNGLIEGIIASKKGGSYVEGFRRGGDAYDRFEIADKALNSML